MQEATAYPQLMASYSDALGVGVGDYLDVISPEEAANLVQCHRVYIGISNPC